MINPNYLKSKNIVTNYNFSTNGETNTQRHYKIHQPYGNEYIVQKDSELVNEKR